MYTYVIARIISGQTENIIFTPITNEKLRSKIVNTRSVTRSLRPVPIENSNASPSSAVDITGSVAP